MRPRSDKPTKGVLSMAEAKSKVEIDTSDLDVLASKIDVLVEKMDILNQALIKAKETLEFFARYASS